MQDSKLQRRRGNVNRTAKHPHERGWRYDRKAATTVIGRKPGESCLMGLPDDRNPPAAAGQENWYAEPTRIPERRATTFKTHQLTIAGSWCRFQPLSCHQATMFRDAYSSASLNTRFGNREPMFSKSWTDENPLRPRRRNFLAFVRKELDTAELVLPRFDCHKKTPPLVVPMRCVKANGSTEKQNGNHAHFREQNFEWVGCRF